MKKTKLLTAIVALLALGMTACGAKTSSGSSAGKPSTSKHTHSWGNWTEVTAPKCDEEGQEKRTCSGCDEVETRKTEPLGHQWGTAENIAASNGGKAYTKCACTRQGCSSIKLEVDFEGVELQQGTASSVSNKAPSVTSGDYVDAFANTIKLANAGNYFEVAFYTEQVGTGKIYQYGTMDYWVDGDSGNKMKTQFAGKDGGSYTEKTTPNFDLKVNNQTIEVTNKKSMGDILKGDQISLGNSDGDKYSPFGYVEIGAATVKPGLNTVRYERVDSYNLVIKSFAFVFVPSQVS